MKKFSFLVMIALLAISFAAHPAMAQAQDDPEAACYQSYYEAVTAKDTPKSVKLARECLAKFPQSPNAKYYKGTINKYINGLQVAFYDALKIYTAAPDAAKLDKQIAAGEAYMVEKPGDLGVTVYLALATSVGSLNGFYKDTDKAKAYTDKALQMLETPTPPEGWQPDQYNSLRDTAHAKLYQFLGSNALKQSPPNLDEAEAYFTKVTNVKSKAAGEGWKDPYLYYLLATEIHSKRYEMLRAEYDALTADEKTGEKGKAVLAKIDPVVDKMIIDHARVVALATAPASQELKTSSKGDLEAFWKYKYTKLDGVNEYVKSLEADPLNPPALPPPPENKAPQQLTVVPGKTVKPGTGKTTPPVKRKPR
jgi:hypothetical protein